MYLSSYQITVISLCSPWNRDDYKAPQKAIDALFSLGSTLTYLDIDLSVYISLGDILSNFPHLVHLETYNVVVSMDTAPECHPRLKTLQFWQHGKYPDIHDITRRLPALEIFVTYPFYHSRDVKVLQDNCPNLKIIACNDYNRYLRDISTTNHDDTSHIGVHTVHIGFNDEFTVDSKDLTEFMIRNSHSIQHLVFHASSPYIHDDHRIYRTRIPNHAIQPVCLSRMTTYSQRIYGEHDMLLTRWIASKSPHLKKLALNRYIAEDIDTSGLFDDLVGCCALETLTIPLSQLASMDMTGIERFIRYHSTIDSQLHTLTLPEKTRLSNDALDALATLPRLENLSIELPLVQHQDSDGEHFSRFIHKLALGCPRLKHLDISSEGPIPDKIILRLSELSVTSLHLDLYSYKDQMPMSLLSLLQCPRLRELHIVTDGCEGDPHKHLRDVLNSKIDVVTGI